MDFTKSFLLFSEKYKEFNTALEIVKRNSEGKIWLIGGFVYRGIASQIYGISKPEIDLDFIVEKNSKEYSLPENWVISKNRFGNPKFVNEFTKEEIDFVPINNIYSIKQRNLEPTIENYLSGVPLNVQSIVFDISKKEIIGNVGIQAIKDKVVKVNDIEFARYAAKKKELTLNEMIYNKANSLGFRAIYSEVRNS